MHTVINCTALQCSPCILLGGGIMEESEKPNASHTAYRHFIYFSFVAVADFIQRVFILLFPDVLAAIDTLPTAANLQRWNKSNSDKCKLCFGRQTTDHCLNICKVGLYTGRCAWRHDNILNYVMESLDTSKYTTCLFTRLDRV